MDAGDDPGRGLSLTGSSFTGAVRAEEGADVRVTLDGNSTWTLTGDSRVTAFEGDPA